MLSELVKRSQMNTINRLIKISGLKTVSLLVKCILRKLRADLHC